MSLQTWQETLITSQTDGTAVTAAAATTLLPAAAKYTLPANFFAIGRQLMIKATGRLSTVITTPGTWRFDVRFGATLVFDSLAGAFNAATASAYNNIGWVLEIILTCRAIGATGNLMGQGTFIVPNMKGTTDAAMPLGATVGVIPWNSAPAVGSNFDTTATQQVDLFWTQTAATGSIQCHQYSLIALN
jgi:hypothetical protein